MVVQWRRSLIPTTLLADLAISCWTIHQLSASDIHPTEGATERKEQGAIALTMQADPTRDQDREKTSGQIATLCDAVALIGRLPKLISRQYELPMFQCDSNNWPV